MIDKRERDPFQLSNGEWQFLKRHGINVKEIKMLCKDAWAHSDSLQSFKHALEERNLFLAKGDRRGFVVMDHTNKVYLLSRHGGISTRDIKNRLGSSDQLPTVEVTKSKIRSTFNGEILKRIQELKRQHEQEILPALEKKALLVHIQKAERRELSDHQRVKRNLVAMAGKDRFRRGIRGFSDKVTGKEKRVRLVNRKEVVTLKRRQTETRQMMIFRHNRDRGELQREISKIRASQRQERVLLAKRIHEFRQVQGRDQERKASISREFERSNNEQKAARSTDIDKARITRRKRKPRTRRLDR
ncbi:hypothetical protein N9R59_04120 [Porticoccaceae bacterium]|nr:hypothetical protein [Porticoccaceae bacterium]